jgi:hypothetical protein
MKNLLKKNFIGSPRENLKKGFVILYAILMTSLLLSIGLGIYEISIKEFTLSASASDSQVSIFSADTGLECALYWDLKATGNGGQTIFQATSSVVYRNSNNITCDNNVLVNAGGTPNSNNMAVVPASDGSSATTTFKILLPQTSAFSFDVPTDTNDPCALVAVGKKVNADKSVSTFIQSRGYNTCNGNNPRRVERGLQVRY